MAMTISNTNILSLLNILNRTAAAQGSVLHRMATGKNISTGADDPAGLLALTKLGSQLTAVDAGISNNQRTDAMLSVADGSLTQIGSLMGDITRLANETANGAALTSDEVAANQSQIDDALSSIDRIVGSTNFNGKNLLDGSLGINYAVGDATKITDVKVFSRKAGTADATLTVDLTAAASNASVSGILTGTSTHTRSFMVQGLLGTAVISVGSSEAVSSVVAKVNAAVNQTGVSATYASTQMNLTSQAAGSSAFVRTKLIDGAGVAEKNARGTDAVVTVNGQKAAVDGNHVNFSANGISLSFENAMTTAGSTTISIYGDGAAGKSGATFSLGTNGDGLATLGIDGLYTAQLGNQTDGYLKSLASGGANSLLNDPAQAATIARAAAMQVATVQGRIGGFQKFQVRTAVDALNNNKEGLSKVQSTINDVDYASASAELNRQNVLLQAAMSLLGLANQQSTQVLSLLK